CIKAIFAHTLTAPLSLIEMVIDPIIDSFNDDAWSVRLHSVRTLTSIYIIHKMSLDEDRFDLIIHLLVDNECELRMAVCKLLQVITTLTNTECIRSLFKTLSRAYSKYPTDLEELVLTAGKIGFHHAQLIEAMIPGLLRLEKYFVPVESRVEDPN